MNYELVVNNEKESKPDTPTSFLVKIIYNEDTSIQGQIQWIEEEKTLSFRSLMELIFLFENALSKEKARDVGFRFWDN